MKYIFAPTGQILDIVPKKPDDNSEGYIAVPDWFIDGRGRYITEYDESWNLRPIDERVRLGLFPDANLFKLVDGEVIAKTHDELVAEGIVDPPQGVKVDPVPISEAFLTGEPRLYSDNESFAISKKEERILKRLESIDLETIRPLRAIRSGKGTDDDQAKIDALDAEAEALRAELGVVRGELRGVV